MVLVPLPKLLFPFWYCLRICCMWKIYYCQMLHVQIHHFNPNWSCFYQLDLGWPQPSVTWSRTLTPGQRLRSGHKEESTDSYPVDQWSVTRAPAFLLCRKEFPQRWKVVRQVKCSLRVKSYVYVWLNTLSREDNGNPLQCSCLENPMDGGAW